MTDSAIRVDLHTSLDTVSQQDWDRCADALSHPPADPFTTYRFLKALEDSGSVGEGTGWVPYYMTAHLDDVVIGCAPLYLKYHSQGEYIFDHSFAHTYEQAGGRYYPKLQIAVPFTPATGSRFLALDEHKDIAQTSLTRAAMEFATNNNLSSVHVTFCTSEESDFGQSMGVLPRVTQQFHWQNASYADFNEFLSNLASRKRKNIRKERDTANAFGGEIVTLTGDDIQPEHWDAFWHFYQDTGARKWGQPYLTRDFFNYAQEHLRNDMALVLAVREGHYVAGALNFIGRTALFGRYWGCVEHHPCLHFEICYYRAIEFAIERGLQRVEAGAQGEHKLARGYMPTKTHSLHWFPEPRFHEAVKDYLRHEEQAISYDIDILTSYGPFKAQKVEEQN